MEHLITQDQLASFVGIKTNLRGACGASGIALTIFKKEFMANPGAPPNEYSQSANKMQYALARFRDNDFGLVKFGCWKHTDPIIMALTRHVREVGVNFLRTKTDLPDTVDFGAGSKTVLQAFAMHHPDAANNPSLLQEKLNSYCNEMLVDETELDDLMMKAIAAELKLHVRIWQQQEFWDATRKKTKMGDKLKLMEQYGVGSQVDLILIASEKIEHFMLLMEKSEAQALGCKPYNYILAKNLLHY